MTDQKTHRIKPAYPERQRIRWSRLGLFATMGFFLIQFMLTGCTVVNKTSRLELTPVTDPPTGVHHHGKFVWNDLLTDDVVVAKEFYGRLFGWTFEPSGSYTVVKNDGQNIGGMVQIGQTSKITGVARWLCVLSVADVDEAAALVSEKGGSVHEGPLDMLNRGRGALVSDPQGAQLVLLNALGGDPEDKEPVIGSWLWHELWSNDSEASLTFYRKLAGYDFDGEKTDYLILLKDGQWRAGIRFLPDSELETRWVPVVRVADTEDIAVRTKTLGGKVLVEPRPTAGDGSVALLSDPSDALFLIQRWSAKTSEQEK